MTRMAGGLGRAAFGGFVLLLASLDGAAALEALGGDRIKAIVGGATIEGSMNDGTRYSTYYAPDGTLRGADYAGKWTVEDDTLCLAYDDVEGEACFQVGGNEQGIMLMRDGKVAGQGAVTKGNVRAY